MMYSIHSKPRTGNRVEPSAHRFLAEGSDKRLSTQYLRPNIQRKKFALNVRHHFQCPASFHATEYFSEEKR
jgi:hypothetical protein